MLLLASSFSYFFLVFLEPDLRIAMYGYNMLKQHRKETISRTGRYIVLKLLSSGGERVNIDVRYIITRGVPIRPEEKKSAKYSFQDIPQLFVAEN